MTTAVVVSLVGLIVIIAVHIAVIARWSGRLDGMFAAYMKSNDQRISDAEAEIIRLRDARHKSDGDIQRHEGWLKELDRRQASRRRTVDCPITEGDG